MQHNLDKIKIKENEGEGRSTNKQTNKQERGWDGMGGIEKDRKESA